MFRLQQVEIGLRLSNVCVATLGLVFLAGLLPGLYAQTELAQPGLQVVGKESDYNLAISFHILMFAGLMPLIGIALALAVIAEARESKAVRAGAIAALAAAPLGAIALFVVSARTFELPGLPSHLSLSALTVPGLLMLAQAVAGLVALVLLAVLAPGRRRVAIVFAAFSAIAILLSTNLELMLASAGPDHALHDTFFGVAANHMAGVAMALNIFGALAAWSIRWEGVKRLWFSLVAGIAVLATGTLGAAAATSLGLMGMPRKYVDYTPAFARQHWSHTVWLMALAALLAAAIIWLAIAVWRAKRPPGVETAFE